MSTAHRIKAMVNHSITAKRGGHGVHSPFVYELATKVFPGKKPGEIPPAEKWRAACLENKTTINFTDFGTGVSGPRRVCDIARLAAKSPEQGQLLARIVAHFRPEYLLELGTSLGITTLYEGLAIRPQKFVTIEGCPETAALAKSIFEKENCAAQIAVGNFDEILPVVLNDFPRLDYVYFDGNHRLEPTLRYFEWCVAKAQNDSVFIFDDIHWSEEMEFAWEKIAADKRVKVSIDLFDFGIVFFRAEQVKEHFVIKY